MHLTSSGVRPGSACSISAATPLTTAADMDVPLIWKYWASMRYSGWSLAMALLFSMVEITCPPGATTSGLTKPSTVGPAEEKEARKSSVPFPGV